MPAEFYQQIVDTLSAWGYVSTAQVLINNESTITIVAALASGVVPAASMVWYFSRHLALILQRLRAAYGVLLGRYKTIYIIPDAAKCYWRYASNSEGELVAYVTFHGTLTNHEQFPVKFLSALLPATDAVGLVIAGDCESDPTNRIIPPFCVAAIYFEFTVAEKHVKERQPFVSTVIVWDNQDRQHRLASVRFHARG